MTKQIVIENKNPHIPKAHRNWALSAPTKQQVRQAEKRGRERNKAFLQSVALTEEEVRPTVRRHEKRCCKCEEVKRLVDFPKNGNNLDGRAEQCRTCCGNQRRNK